MSEFAKLAQDFVEATSLLVGQRTINIMDQKGIIIASTEKHRIGDFHQGASEVLATGKPVRIKKEDLPRYPGTKEGYNMPIFLNDEIIGVVGIFGCEEEVQSIANLLRVYVTQSFSQFQMTQKQNLEAELRNQLLRLLLFGGKSQKEMITKLCGMLDLRLKFPVRIILLYERAAERNMKHLLDYHQFIQNLIWKNVLDRRCDVFGIQNADYVILLGGSGELLETRKRLDKLLQEIEREAVWDAAVSSPCRNMEEVSEGMKEVSVLRNRRGGMIQNLEEHTCRMQYLMGRFTVQDGARTVVRMLRRLEDQQHIVGQILLFAEPPGQLQENGHVAVMAAGMHHPRVGRGVGHLVLFLDGQGIRIRPEGNGILLSEIKKSAQGAVHGRKHLAVQVFQSGTQIFHGLGQVPVQFRDPVQRPAVIGQLHILSPP